MKRRFGRKVFAAALALTLMTGNVPLQPVTDLLGDMAITASAADSLILGANRTNTRVISEANGNTYNVTLSGKKFYTDGTCNTMVAPFSMTAEQVASSLLKNFAIKELKSSTADLSGDGTITLNFEDVTSIEAGKPYVVVGQPLIIKNKEDWDAFAARVNNGEHFSGKVVKLSDDFDNSTDPITENDLVGSPSSSNKKFSGFFDGSGRTLTVNINSDEQYCAPFRYVSSMSDGVKFMNLRIAGSITSTNNMCGGLIGKAAGGNIDIENCISSVTITDNYNNKDYTGCFGGFISNIASGHVTFTNCLFNGQLLKGDDCKNNGGNGGFVSIVANGANYSIALDRCLFDPSTTPTMISYKSYPFFRVDGSDTVTSCSKYYYTTLFGTRQGYNAVGMQAEDLLDDERLGSSVWEVVDNHAVPKMTADSFYIDQPKFSGVVVSDTAPDSVGYSDDNLTFSGSYDPFENKDSVLFSKRNNNEAFEAALRVKEMKGNGFEFLDWSVVGSESDLADNTLVLRAGRKERLYDVNIADGIAGGTVSAKTTAYAGETVTLTVTPDTGYNLVRVTAGDTEITPENDVYSFTMPAEDVTVTAEFELKKFTVTWTNGTTVLETDENVPYGTIPEYNGETPEKDKDSNYTYAFVCWNPRVLAVTADTVYTAEFTRSDRTDKCGNNAFWSFDAETGKLTIYGTGPMQSYVANYVRTPWDKNHFRNDITSIEIQNGITSVGKLAFADCKNLTSVIMSNSVETIDKSAFHNCTALTSVIIPDSVETIGEQAFHCCSGLQSVVLPYNLKTIGASAFEGCSGLTSITIPGQVTSIADNAFKDCTNLTDVYLFADPNELNWNDEDNDDFITDSNDSQTVCHVPGDVSSNIYANVEYRYSPMGKCGETAYWCFDDQKHRLTIAGSGAMKDYGRGEAPWYRFSDYITSVVIEDGITSIGTNAFYGCNQVPSITIPAGVTSIGSDAFKYCTSTAVVYCYADPAELTWDEDGCNDFRISAPRLTVCRVPAEYLAEYETKFGSSVNVTFKALNPSGKCGGRAKWEFDSETGVLTISGSSAMSDYDIENPPWEPYLEGITSVEIENGITYIGSCAFQNHTGITSVTLPDSVKRLGDASFYNCVGLTSVTLSENVGYIGTGVFEGCTSLSHVYCYAAPDILRWEASGGNDFITEGERTKIHVPAVYYKLYCQKFGSKINADFVSMNPYGICGDNVGWELDLETGLLTISGTGNMYFNTAPWEKYKNAITSVAVASSVNNIADFAFKGCAQITSVTLDEGLTSIGLEAFFNCTSLDSVSIPESVQDIAGYAFEGTPWLAAKQAENPLVVVNGILVNGQAASGDIMIPDGVTVITNNAFYCTNYITSVIIPKSVTKIKADAFAKCCGLNAVCFLSADPAELSEFAFEETDTTIYVPSYALSKYCLNWSCYEEFIQPLPGPVILTQPASLSKAIGEQAKFTVTATGVGLTYQWHYNKGDGWRISNGTGAKTNTLTINTAAGYNNYQYRCVITDGAGSEVISEIATLEVKTTITAQPASLSKAIGEQAKFTVTATGVGLTYQWQYNKGDGWRTSNGTGAKTNTLTINTAAGYNNYQYRCIITDINGNKTYSGAATLKVKTAITAQPASLTKPIGEAANFTVKASGAGLTYQWQYNKGDGWKTSNGTGAKTNTLTINTAAGYNNYQYRCVITDANGAKTISSAAKLTVSTAITAQPADTSAAINEAAKFTVKATGAGLKYQWQYNSGDGWKNSGASGNKTAELTIYGKTTYNNWQFRCVITDANSAATTSSVAVLKINTTITAQPAKASAAINEAAKFTVKATGIGLSYQWQYNNGEGWKNSGASGNKTAELTLYSKTAYNGWQFRCVITDGNGKTTTSDAAAFTVKTKITAQPASVEAASGTAAKFTVKATGLDLSYQWQYNNGSGWKNSNGSGAATDTLTINAKATYNNWQYRCVITDGNGAKTYSDAAQLTVK